MVCIKVMIPSALAVDFLNIFPFNSSGYNHFWISVSSFVIGWDQNQNKANLAERYWKQEEPDLFFFVAALL